MNQSTVAAQNHFVRVSFKFIFIYALEFCPVFRASTEQWQEVRINSIEFAEVNFNVDLTCFCLNFIPYIHISTRFNKYHGFFDKRGLEMVASCANILFAYINWRKGKNLISNFVENIFKWTQFSFSFPYVALRIYVNTNFVIGFCSVGNPQWKEGNCQWWNVLRNCSFDCVNISYRSNSNESSLKRWFVEGFPTTSEMCAVCDNHGSVDQQITN